MKIVWTGPQRRVPRIGLCAKGHIIDTDDGRLTAHDAHDLVRQELAKYYRPKGKRTAAEKE